MGREQGAQHVGGVTADRPVALVDVVALEDADAGHSESRRWNDFGRVTARNPSVDRVTPRPESFTPVHASAGSR